MCSGSEAGSKLRLMYFCITQLQACEQSRREEDPNQPPLSCTVQVSVGLRMSSKGGGEDKDPYVVQVRNLPPSHSTSPVIKLSYHQLSRTDQIVDFQTSYLS